MFAYMSCVYQDVNQGKFCRLQIMEKGFKGYFTFSKVEALTK